MRFPLICHSLSSFLFFLALGWPGTIEYCQIAAAAAATGKQPNIVMIFTDDQDLHLGSLVNMTRLHEKLIKQGTTFTNHWATVAQCCPSRASLFRGQAAHNTNITDVIAPG
jgi:N-acetylglucosamine-6-sulfatase